MISAKLLRYAGSWTRGFAHGVDTDMVTNSLEFFPVGTAEDFRDLLEAIISSPPRLPG
jgi:hypothetical protein